MSIAEKLTTIAENEQRVYEAGQKSMVDESKVIVKTAVGNPLTVDDVSEIPHEASIQLLKRNMLPSRALSVGNYTKIDNYRCAYPCELPVGNYIFNAEAKESADDIGYFYLQRKSTDGSDDWTSYVQFIMNKTAVVANAFSIEEGYEYRFWVYSAIGVFPLDYFTGVRIEADINLSGVAVDVGGKAVVVDENGCADVKTVSPTMTLAVDTEFIDIALTYHKSWGMQVEYDAFWDAFQSKGKRYNYNQAFYGSGWNDENYNPKYPFGQVRYATGIFAQSGITDTKQPLDLTNCSSTSNLFQSCQKLKTIRTLTVSENTPFNNGMFSLNGSLENIEFAGTIGQKGMNLEGSPKLTTASLLSILTALSKDSTVATGKTVTFATASKAVIEADTDCMTQYNLAINAGWTIAFNET